MAGQQQPLFKQETRSAVENSVHAGHSNRSAAIYLMASFLVLLMLAWVIFLSWGVYSLSKSIFSSVEASWSVMTTLLREL